MDAISDTVFTDLTVNSSSSDDPSLLTVVLDISPKGWFKLKDRMTIQEATKYLLVFLNAHLSLNNSNKVAFIASGPSHSKFLYPNPEKNYDEVVGAKENDGNSSVGQSEDGRKKLKPELINKDMYRQFRIVDEAVLEELNECLEEIGDKITEDTLSTLSGAISMALTYTNRILRVDLSISTSTASAISSTAHMTASGSSDLVVPNATTSSLTSMKSRLLIVTTRDDDNLRYIPIMNSIFAAQKMRLSIDVANLGSKSSSYLQQAADATNGVYLHISDPQGLIQILSTAFFIEPSIRPLIILPTNSNVNYRASCFITGKSVDLGYVCSVCLCIMSIIPENDMCPTCGLKFDAKVLEQLRRGPSFLGKRRKLDSTAAA
ncbi:uncharacterized protein PRCAT00001894001 [Priceomyces carsonii]|uniref:uncharacterized protein n=1 Tax=Priceomyces carsonii TaxID=28549 RepID=UPI002EDBA0B9|nr:unnamed protein product [Priceomyces carsonii]